jgi:pimeloyl-ACP methyl ester carboxylesterase
MEQMLGTIRPLIADGEKEQAPLTVLNTVRTPEPAVEELRSGANWQVLVNAADTLPREFEQLVEYEFEPDRYREVTTPTLLLLGEESSPGAIEATETVDETLPHSRIVRIDGADHFGLISKPDPCVEAILAFVRDAD